MKLLSPATVTAACALLLLSACSSNTDSASTTVSSPDSSAPASISPSASPAEGIPQESPSSLPSPPVETLAEAPTLSTQPASELPASSENLAELGKSCGLLYGKNYLEATLIEGSISCNEMIAIFEKDIAENTMDVRLTDHPVGSFSCKTYDWDTALQLGVGTVCSTGKDGTTIISRLNSNASAVDGRSPNLFALSDNPPAIVFGSDYQHTVGPSQPGTAAFKVGEISCYIPLDGTATCNGYNANQNKNYWFNKAGYNEVTNQIGYSEGYAPAQKELPRRTLLDANGAECSRGLDDTISCSNADGSYFSYGPHGFSTQR